MFKAIIFDYGRTLADGESDELYPEALPLLEELHKRGYKMGLVSRTQDPEKRKSEIIKKGLTKYFQVFDIFPAGSTKNFSKVFTDLKADPKDCLIVGDRIKSEIVEGNKVGATTCWVKQGKFATELPETQEENPDYTIDSLSKLLDIISSHEER